jgi:hypothetical protein
MVVTILGFFFKTVFRGASISKLSLVPEWDSFFSHWWTGVSVSCDPSVVQLIGPYSFLAAKFWHSGCLPLWNPYSGLGMPFVGDLQSSPFSPLRILFFLFPSAHTYNLSLVLQVVLAAVGTYLCCRQLFLPRYAAVVAAFAYAICPFNLHYLELASGTSSCVFPVLFWLFLRVADCQSLGRLFTAGAGCAALIFSGHPESSFFGITFGCMTMVVLMFARAPRWTSVIRSAFATACIGAIAFCLAAPVLLPFYEYLCNCESYKFGIGGSTWVPWQGILYNLILPGFAGASPYLGAICALAWPLALCSLSVRDRRWLSLTIVALVALAITCRLGPLNGVFMSPPFNTLITVYCLPVLLLLIVILCAAGLTELVQRPTAANGFWLVAGLTLVTCVPWVLHFANTRLAVGDFDMTVPHMSFNSIVWLKQAVLATLISVAIMSAGKRRLWRSWILPGACIAVSFASLAMVSKDALPTMRSFNYPNVQPISTLQRSNERIVALGDHLLRPNTNVVYGISDIRTHNVLFPPKFLRFNAAAGATVDMFNQVFDSADSPLLDLASVRYVLSLDRLHESGQLRLVEKTDQPAYLYERTSALPRQYLLHNVVTVQSDEDALRYMLSRGFNPRREAVLEKNVTLERLPAGAHSESGTISQLKVLPDAVRSVVDVSAPCLLVSTDVFYPGWLAEIDGKRAEILRANYLFRAVVIPAGHHTVLFRYAPASFQMGISLAAGCMLVILALAGVLWWQRRRALKKVVESSLAVGVAA